MIILLPNGNAIRAEEIASMNADVDHGRTYPGLTIRLHRRQEGAVPFEMFIPTESAEAANRALHALREIVLDERPGEVAFTDLAKPFNL